MIPSISNIFQSNHETLIQSQEYRLHLNPYMQVCEALIRRSFSGTWAEFCKDSLKILQGMPIKERNEIRKQLEFDNRFLIVKSWHKSKYSPYSNKRLKDSGKKRPRCLPKNRSYFITVIPTI